MKSKIMLSTFVLVVFLFGLAGGFYAGVVGGAASTSGQLYAGAKEMQVVAKLIDKAEYAKAKDVLCTSLKFRIQALALVSPIQQASEKQEIDRLVASVFGLPSEQATDGPPLCGDAL
ncbi:hypothetical protein ACFSJ3_05770 [Corallincola platygyrae]|uniref:Uncharacterized protein n=1 Tax=Corallincola platygyrae TaxID=1193278 RepID=A0ABW4XK40_9GAMM